MSKSPPDRFWFMSGSCGGTVGLIAIAVVLLRRPAGCCEPTLAPTSPKNRVVGGPETNALAAPASRNGAINAEECILFIYALLVSLVCLSFAGVKCRRVCVWCGSSAMCSVGGGRTIREKIKKSRCGRYTCGLFAATSTQNCEQLPLF